MCNPLLSITPPPPSVLHAIHLFFGLPHFFPLYSYPSFHFYLEVSKTLLAAQSLLLLECTMERNSSLFTCLNTCLNYENNFAPAFQVKNESVKFFFNLDSNGCKLNLKKKHFNKTT